MDSIKTNDGYEIAINAKAEKALTTAATEMGFANPEALTYVILYGLNKSLQDRVAGMKAKLEAEKTEDGFAKWSPHDIEVTLRDAKDERFADILAGEVGGRSAGPRLKGRDKLAFEFTVDILKAIYGKANKKWPSGEGAAEVIRKNVDELWTKRPQVKDKAYAEADAKIEQENAMLGDLADLTL